MNPLPVATGGEAGTDTALSQRVADLRGRVERACQAAGRSPSSVLLIAVSKTHPPALARQAVALGVGDLGENRVQELLAKMDHVPDARWHMIGRLQTNKAKHVVGRRVLVHSVDRRSLADALSRRAEQAGVVQRVLVQVDVAGDPDKGGCHIDDVHDLLAYARELPNLAVEGLMTMPPLPPPGEPADAAARPHFARLRELRDDARCRWPEVAHLSMGMTADLEAAIAEGATMVRVGSAVFGPRNARPWQPADGAEGARS